MMAVALFCGVCVLGHGGGAAGGGASFSDVVDPAEIAATCRGFLVAANRTIATARWMDGQPVEGYRRVHPTMCCGLCRLRQFTCRGWSADPVTSRCWLYGTDGGGGGGTIVTKEEPGTVCGVHSKSVITSTEEVGEGGERSRRAAAMVAEGDPSPGPAARVDPAMGAQLDALPPIPHKLHIIFPHKGIVNSTTPMAVHGVRRMIELNPRWAWKVYDDDEIDKYIGQELTRPDPILTPKEVGVLQKAHPIEKTDAARLLIMWYEGGFYQDADRVYSVPMSKVISPEVKMVLPTLDIPPSFMQDVMCTSPGNPIVRRSIELSGEIRMAVHRLHGEASKRSTLTMGLTWTNAITLELFGLPRIKDDAEMAAARAAMAKVPALKSSAEGWCDGIWVQPYEGCRGVSRSSLYNEFKLAGWADTLNKKWTKKCDEVRRERSLLKDAKNPEAKKRMDKTMNRYECHDPNHAPPK